MVSIKILKDNMFDLVHYPNNDINEVRKFLSDHGMVETKDNPNDYFKFKIIV